MRRFAPWLLLALVLAAFLVGREVRVQMQLGYSAESLRGYVHQLGLVGPLVFVGLVSFRQFLLLPSLVVLTAGGLIFGAPLGTALGALGLLLSGGIGFAAARGMGREWVRAYLERRFPGFERRVERAGLALVGLATAHPMGVMTPVHWGAGLTAIRPLPFLLVLALAGLVRAFAYSLFGAALVEPGRSLYAAMAVLAVAALAPLVHPGLRRRLLAVRAAPPA